jgi:hypothetical protein
MKSRDTPFRSLMRSDGSSQYTPLKLREYPVFMRIKADLALRTKQRKEELLLTCMAISASFGSI